jgi:hypothetical protein
VHPNEFRDFAKSDRTGISCRVFVIWCKMMCDPSIFRECDRKEGRIVFLCLVIAMIGKCLKMRNKSPMGDPVIQRFCCRSWGYTEHYEIVEQLHPGNLVRLLDLATNQFTSLQFSPAMPRNSLKLIIEMFSHLHHRKFLENA